MIGRFLAYLLILIMCLSPFIGFITFSYFNTTFYHFLFMIVVVTFVIFLLEKLIKKEAIFIPKYLWYYIALILYVGAQDIFLKNSTTTITFYSNLIGGVLSIIIVENTKFTKRIIKIITKINFVVVIWAISTIIIQQSLNEYFFIRESNKDLLLNADIINFRLPSIYSWTNIIDSGFSFLPISGVLLFNLSNKNKNNLLYVFIIGILVFAFLTKYRWIMINSVILVYFLFKYSKKFFVRKKMMRFIIFVAFFYLTYQSMVLFDIPITKIVDERILEKDRGGVQYGSASTRLFAFVVFADLFPEHPIFGKGMLHGFGDKSKDISLERQLGNISSQIHVGYLSLLYYFGIIGAFFFLLFLIKMLKQLKKDFKKSGYWVAYYSFIGFSIANLTLVSFSFFWVGLIISLVYNKYYLDNNYLLNE